MAHSHSVLPHGPLEALADNLWRVKGAVPRMSLERVMTVVRRSDGLLIHSAIWMDEQRMHELEALGEPKFLVVPNQGHRLDAPKYKALYPNLKIFAPRGGRRAIEEKVPVDGTYEDFPHDSVVTLETLPGVGEQEGVMHVHSADGLSLVFNDLVMNMDRRKDLLGLLFTTLMGSAPGPRISRLSRLMFVKDKNILRDRLEALAALPHFTRLIVSHDAVAEGADAARALRQAISYLR